MNKVKSLKEIVEQIRSCGFECEAGPLENNVDFQLLEQIAGIERPKTLRDKVEEAAEQFKRLGQAMSESFLAKPVSPQQQRDAIVELAKKDVEDLQDYESLAYAYAEFVVNSEKRTVVALIYNVYGRERVISKGIAKCAPTDCFNAHIGKAIALRRALGLEVPAEYLNAPQPTEVRVGDVVEWNTPRNSRYIINAKQSKNLYGFINAVTGIDYGILKYDNLIDKVTVIDDTREGVDGE